MRRGATVLALAVGGLITGCAYDPYAGTYVPCCSYYGGPYAYRSPTPYYNAYGYQTAPYRYQPAPYGDQAPAYSPAPQAQPGGYQYQTAPYAPPPQAQPGAYPYQPPPVQPYGTLGTAATPEGGWIAERFVMANTARDGRLTREQAAAGMPFVADNFDAIDVDRKGYVTLSEVRAFAEYRRPDGGPPGTPTLQ